MFYKVRSAAFYIFLIAFWIGSDFFLLGKFSPVTGGPDNFAGAIANLLSSGIEETATFYWQRLGGGGFDILAQGFYPPVYRLPFHYLPGWSAIIFVSGAPIISGVVGVYFLCRRTFGLSEMAALFAGFIWVFNFGGRTFLLTSTIGYLPLMLAAMTYLLDDKSEWRRWVLAIVACFLMSAGSYISKVLPFPFLIVAIWFLLADPRRKILDWIVLGLLALFAGLLRLPEVVAILNNAPLSSLEEFRERYDLSGSLVMTFTNFLGMFKSYVGYVTAFSLALIIIPLMTFSDKTKPRRIAVCIVVGALLPFILTIAKSVLVGFLPFFSSLTIAAILAPYKIFIVIGGAFGMEGLLRLCEGAGFRSGIGPRLLRLAPRAAFAFVIILSLFYKYIAVHDWITNGSYVLNFESPVLEELADRRQADGQPTRAITHQMFGSTLNAYGIETIDAMTPFVFRRYHNFWWKAAEKWRSGPDWGMRGEHDIGGQTNFLVANHKPVWRFDDYFNMDMLSLANTRYFVSRDRLEDPDLVLLSGPDKGWSTLSRNEKVWANLKQNFTGRTTLFVYENPNAFPRFFSVDNLRTFETGEQVLAAMGTASRDELRNNLFVERSLLPAHTDTSTTLDRASVRVNEYENDRIVLDINSDAPSILIVTNSYSPFWTAEIDGQPAEIFPADHAFWGVFLPAGAKQVTFGYQPPQKF